MYAMLGDVRFELLNSFTSLEMEHAANFAKHEVANADRKSVV